MIRRLILKLSALPGKLLHGFRQAEMRQVCAAGIDTVFHASSSIDNFNGDPSFIRVGNDTHLLGQLLVFPNGGRISIGRECFIGEHSRIWSMSEVSIGDRVQISHGVNIHDNAAHSLSAAERHAQLSQILRGGGHPKDLGDVATAAITIGDDAWIGFNATILGGVNVGAGAVVGACAVVNRDVPAYTIVAGNPALIIGTSKP
jgi:acetyltransferase-like isoleucine patch superfamily enzyme